MAYTSTTVHIGENSPEEVAHKLMHEIAKVEGLNLYQARDGKTADRKWILDTYADACRR